MATNSSTFYDSSADTWKATGPMNFPRSQHRMVSDGSKAFVFGGLTTCTDGSTTGPGLEVFNPATKGWTPVTTSGAPVARYAHSMAWTGSEVLVFGGSTTALAVASGARYNPTTGKWTDTSCAVGNCARVNAVLFVDGGFVKMWGGIYGDSPAGRQLNLASGMWSAWSVPTGVVLPGDHPDDGKRIFVIENPGPDCTHPTTVRVLDRSTGKLVATDNSAAPDGVVNASAVVWSGGEVIAWSGGCGAAPTNGGGRYQPAAP
jgi:hypothetical protein